MRVFYWSADEGACRYYRCELPARGLTALGHEAHVGGVMPDWWRDTADVIVGQRVCLPGASERWRNLSRQGRAKLVLEIDDDLFDVHPTNKAGHEFYGQTEVRDNLATNIRIADLVTVTTHRLADRLSHLNGNIAVLPNCVPQAVLDLPPVADGDVLTVGWGGSFTHAIDWRQHAEHVARVIARNQSLSMHSMGDWCDDVLQRRIPPDRFRRTGWIQSVDELHRAIDFHIGVIPLRDMPFNLSKSPIKFVELAARGIPAVCSDVGPYRDTVIDGVTGLLVRTPTDWARLIGALVDDPDLRTSMGKRARDWATDLTIEANVHRWVEAYA